VLTPTAHNTALKYHPRDIILETSYLTKTTFMYNTSPIITIKKQENTFRLPNIQFKNNSRNLKFCSALLTQWSWSQA